MRFTIFKRMAFGYALIMLMVVFMGIYVTLKVNQLTGINYQVARVDGAMISMGEQLLESLFSQAGFGMKYLVSSDQDFHKEFYSKRALFEATIEKLSYADVAKAFEEAQKSANFYARTLAAFGAQTTAPKPLGAEQAAEAAARARKEQASLMALEVAAGTKSRAQQQELLGILRLQSASYKEMLEYGNQLQDSVMAVIAAENEAADQQKEADEERKKRQEQEIERIFAIREAWARSLPTDQQQQVALLAIERDRIQMIEDAEVRTARMAELTQRFAEMMEAQAKKSNKETKDTIGMTPLQATRAVHYLVHPHDFSPLQSQPSGHDETDVAGAQDDYLLAGEVAVDVDEPLRHSSGEYAGRACARNADAGPGAFTAAHGQYYAFRLNLKGTVLGTERRYDPV